MKSKTILASLTSVLTFSVQSGSATCFSDFINSWTQVGRNQAIDFVWFACTQPGGMFTGYYNPGQTKAMCPKDSLGRGLQFEVQNLNNNAGFDLGDGDCVQRLQNEILGCNGGGQSTVAGWRFRAVPNGC